MKRSRRWAAVPAVPEYRGRDTVPCRASGVLNFPSGREYLNERKLLVGAISAGIGDGDLGNEIGTLFERFGVELFAVEGFVINP